MIVMSRRMKHLIMESSITEKNAKLSPLVYTEVTPLEQLTHLDVVAWKNQ